MTASLPLGPYIVRVVIPLAGVLLAVALLGLAAALVFVNIQDERLQLSLFAAGVLSWIFGIGWGVLVNGTPLPPSSRG